MSLENATEIQQLVPTNPEGSDPVSEGDNHLRMVKLCLQNSLPGMTAPWQTTSEIKCADPTTPESVVTLGYLQALPNNSPIGWPLLWLLPDLPSADYIEFIGQELDRTIYAGLFAVYGTKYGAGNGTTTFNVPDSRGYFPRFMDGAAGRDPDAGARTARPDGTAGNAVGTTQEDAFKSHVHTMEVQAIFGGSGVNGFRPVTESGTPTQTGMEPIGGAESRPKNMYFRLIARAK